MKHIEQVMPAAIAILAIFELSAFDMSSHLPTI
jgi:hypothetical protein